MNFQPGRIVSCTFECAAFRCINHWLVPSTRRRRSCASWTIDLTSTAATATATATTTTTMAWRVIWESWFYQSISDGEGGKRTSAVAVAAAAAASRNLHKKWDALFASPYVCCRWPFFIIAYLQRPTTTILGSDTLKNLSCLMWTFSQLRSRRARATSQSFFFFIFYLCWTGKCAARDENVNWTAGSSSSPSKQRPINSTLWQMDSSCSIRVELFEQSLSMLFKRTIYLDLIGFWLDFV